MVHGSAMTSRQHAGTPESLWRRWLALGGIAGAFGVMYWMLPGLRASVQDVIGAMAHGDVAALKTFILSFGAWAPAMSFMLMILQTLIAPLPAFALAIANAMAFGMVYGCALSCVSALVAAFTAFYLSRWCGRPCLERCLGLRSLDTVDTLIERYGVWAVLVARLFPVISFDLISFAAGLTAMPAAGFGLATLIGMLPAAIAFSLLGDSMASANRWSLIGGVVLLGLLLAGAAAMRKSMAWRRARAAYRVSEYEATGSPTILRDAEKPR